MDLGGRSEAPGTRSQPLVLRDLFEETVFETLFGRHSLLRIVFQHEFHEVVHLPMIFIRIGAQVFLERAALAFDVLSGFIPVIPVESPTPKVFRFRRFLDHSIWNGP